MSCVHPVYLNISNIRRDLAVATLLQQAHHAWIGAQASSLVQLVYSTAAFTQLRMHDCAGIACGVMGVEELAPDAPLMEQGLDSLAAVELRNAAATAFGVQLGAAAALHYPTLKACVVMPRCPVDKYKWRWICVILSVGTILPNQVHGRNELCAVMPARIDHLEGTSLARSQSYHAPTTL